MTLRPTSIRTLLLATIGALTLLIVLTVAHGAWQARERLAEVHALREAWAVSDGFFGAAKHLSTERGIAVSLLFAPPESAANLRPALDESRRLADDALRATLAGLAQPPAEPLRAPLAALAQRRAALAALRAQLDADVALPPAQRTPDLDRRWFRESTALIEETQRLWMAFHRQAPKVDAAGALHTRFKHMLGTLEDYIGREQAVIGRVLQEPAAFTPLVQAQMLKWHGKVELAWHMAETLALQGDMGPPLLALLADARSHYASVYDMVRDVVEQPRAAAPASFPIGVEFWFELSAQSNESLEALRAGALQASRARLAEREAEARREIALRAVVLALAVALCASSIRLVVRRVLEPIGEMVDALVRATRGEQAAFEPARAGGLEEIEKLSHVLHEFHAKSEEVARGTCALEQHARALEHSNRELDDFAYIASHDLKEPLRGIHNHSRFLLEDNQGKLDPESVRRLMRLIQLTQRMERLINDLLYFSRIGRHDLAIQRTDLHEVVGDIEMTLEVFLEERNARIALPRPLPAITCDKTRVAELLRNLVTNAVKYNDAPERVVEIGFLPAHARPDGAPCRNVFYVKDNGRGIAPQFHEDVFRIFKRLQARQEGEEDGTGVGLTFVKKIVERHGGRIWIESELGKGSTFYFTLEGDADEEHATPAA